MRTIRLSRTLLMGLGIVGLSVATELTPVAGNADEGCTLATLRGAYGAQETGTVSGPAGTRLEIAILSRAVFDGHGHWSGTSTESAGGQIARNETFTGTYTVNADCTGTDTATVTPGGLVFHKDFVLTDHARQVYRIDTDPGTVLSGTATRQEN